MVEAADPSPGGTVLDLGSAAGYAGFAVATGARLLIGLDVTPAMVWEASRNARAVGRAAFLGVLGDAEDLPFADAAIDLAVCRYTAHHFHDPTRVLSEVSRVLKLGGRLVVIDNTAPDDPALDVWINRVERLRDPSHVKQWNLSEWRGYFEAAGLRLEVLRTWRHILDFEDWVARQRTPPERVAELRAMFVEAGPAAREAFMIEAGGARFSLWARLMRGRK